MSDQQSPIKESIKEREKNTTAPAANKPNTFALYESNIGPLTPLIADALQAAEKTYTPEWVELAILEAAKSNVRKLKYIEGVLRGYQDRGSPGIGRTNKQAQGTGKATKKNRTPEELERDIAIAATLLENN